MKILLIIAETPYLAEWFSCVVRALATRREEVEFVLYYNSEIAYRDKKALFPSSLNAYRFEPGSGGPRPDATLGLSWSQAYVSWERQWHHHAYRYDYRRIRGIASDLCFSLGSAIAMEKPDFVLYELPSSILGELAHHLASAQPECKYLSVTQSRFPDRIDLCDRKYAFSVDASRECALSDAELARFSDDFAKKRVAPSYMKDGVNRMHESSIVGHYLRRLDRALFFARNVSLALGKRDYESVETYRMLFVSARNHLLRKIRKGFIHRHYSRPTAVRYALFPLHLVPESSVSGQARDFSELVTTIRYIAFSLPMDVLLYVKEHPGAVGTRDGRFYRELAKVPNVRLISHRRDNRRLIAGAEAVITLTSTLGIEAALSGKPVLLLGEVFYEYHPLCRRIRSFDEIAEFFRDKREAIDEVSLEAHNIAFWKAYYPNTIAGNVLNPDPIADHRELLSFLERSRATEIKN